MNDITTTLYSRLLAGETIDDIANEMANALTSAELEYKAELERRAAEEAARKEAEEAAEKARLEEKAAMDAKTADFTALLLDALKYLRTHYPDLVDEEIDEDDDIETLARFFVALLDSSRVKVDWGFAALPNLKWLLLN